MTGGSACRAQGTEALTRSFAAMVELVPRVEPVPRDRR